MPNLFLFFILAFVPTIFFIFIYKRLANRSRTKIITFAPLIFSAKEQKCNPDINTINWDLHKKRLEKYRRSQYKGLTFFVSKDNRIYYLSENGSKVYC